MGLLDKVFHSGKVAIKDKHGRTFWVEKGTEDQYVSTWHGCLKKNAHYMYQDDTMKEPVEVTGWEYHLRQEERLAANKRSLENCLASLEKAMNQTPEETYQNHVRFLVSSGYSKEEAMKVADKARRDR